MVLIGSDANCRFKLLLKSSNQLSFFSILLDSKTQFKKKKKIPKNPLIQHVPLSDWLSRCSDPTSML